MWRLFLLYGLLIAGGNMVDVVEGLACNWGTRSTHPLPPSIVVRLLKENGFDKVKLFEPDDKAMSALGNSGMEVMVGIPNDVLASLAGSVITTEYWVSQNISSYISKHGVDIRYVAVGNEPFLKVYKETYIKVIYSALENVQAALIKAGLGRQVKITIPINADVYETTNGLPSGGDFRSDVRDLMISIIKFLSDNGAPLTINIYPFLSLHMDPNFPVEYAFFSGAASPVVDGSVSYTNVFDANYDTLIWALEKNGFSSLPVIIGEVGWPTDGDSNANIHNAKRFNQGLLGRIIQGQGTPKRSQPPDIYLFSLIDEDAKSIEPGNFERHWGILYYDGQLKYDLNMGNNMSLIPAKGVKYLPRQWCIMAPQASLDDPNLPESISYACASADCTSLGYGSSCSSLDARGNVSYAFNMYYQTNNQLKESCGFSNLSAITTTDPSQGSCRYELMIDTTKHETTAQNPVTTISSVSGRKQNAAKHASLFFILLLFAIYRDY